jgi:hypothetical protein
MCGCIRTVRLVLSRMHTQKHKAQDEHTHAHTHTREDFFLKKNAQADAAAAAAGVGKGDLSYAEEAFLGGDGGARNRGTPV